MTARFYPSAAQRNLVGGQRVEVSLGNGRKPVERIVSAPPAVVTGGWAVWLEGYHGPVPLEWCRPVRRHKGRTVGDRPQRAGRKGKVV